MTDFIKETYNLFAYHLGEETPRGIRLDPKWEPFKKDILDLMSLAYQCGEARANADILEIISERHKAILNEFTKRQQDHWLHKTNGYVTIEERIKDQSNEQS